MEKLVKGFLKFRGEVFGKKKDLFTRLSQIQEPRALFITCSDSRVDPTLMTQAEPGELFILRNAGNMVPPYGSMQGGSTATVEYAMAVLKVPHIIVCGHTDCGVMKGALNPDALEAYPNVAAWLSYAQVEHRDAQPTPEFLLELTENNVSAQLKNLLTHPVVAARMAEGDLTLHGWVYHIGSGSVTSFDEKTQKFQPLGPGKIKRTRVKQVQSSGG